MKIPSAVKLIVEEFEEQKSWIAPLFFVLNRFVTGVINAVNGGLVIGENITGTDFVFDLTYASAASSFPIGFLWQVPNSQPQALVVVSALETPSGLVVPVPVSIAVSWQFAQNGQVQLTDAVKLSSTGGASALTVGNRYQIRVRVTP